MKKILSLFVLAYLIFGLTAAAMAETKVYLDILGSGDYKFDMKIEDYDNGVLDVDDSEKSDFDGDSSGYILGFDSTFDKFKVGIEYGNINSSRSYIKHNGIQSDSAIKFHSTVAEVKGGYRVVDQEKFKLDLVIAVLDINSEVTESSNRNNVHLNFGGNMFGIDVIYNFSEKASLQGILASSLLGANVDAGNVEYSLYYEDPSVTEYKLQFNYSVTDNWGLTLGYRSYQFSGSAKQINYEDILKSDIDGDISGFLIGAVYKF